MSKPFPLKQGTREGCPLFPLVFLLFIEPLASSIRQCNSITEIKSKSLHHKISLYADDILLFITDPVSSLPSLHNIINNLSQVSGYTINWRKSEILPVSKWDAKAGDSIVKETVKPIKYLGIHISLNLNELCKLNHILLLEEIKNSPER